MSDSGHTIADLAAFHANLCANIRAGVDQPTAGKRPDAPELPDIFKEILRPLGNAADKREERRWIGYTM